MPELTKMPSGVSGLDEITKGGLPAGRPTLVCGGAGCGKTLLGATFLVKGALDYGDPGVFVSFEERIQDLQANVASLGFDLQDLAQRRLLAVDHVQINRHTIQETGDYDLEALFVRLAYAAEKVQAKRVVLDSVDSLFAGLPDAAIVRSELSRLFDWLKDRDLTAIVTAERGKDTLTRNGIEEYVSDCVIVLDHRIVEQLSTRRLRIVKYRGSVHGTDEYPFLIDDHGIQIMPVTALGPVQTASGERISSGIESLDAMLEGKGFYKGSSVLLGGGPGTGKTSIASHFADATCRRGQRCTWFCFEEGADQLARNMRSIGIDIGRWQEKGLLHCSVSRPSLRGMELHLALMFREIQEFRPDVIIVDPLSAFLGSGTDIQAKAMSLRMIDHLKATGITALFTSLQGPDDRSEMDISSLMDTWIVLRNARAERGLERRLFIVKSRGMAHSADARKIEITKNGVRLEDLPLPGNRIEPRP